MTKMAISVKAKLWGSQVHSPFNNSLLTLTSAKTFTLHHNTSKTTNTCNTCRWLHMLTQWDTMVTPTWCILPIITILGAKMDTWIRFNMIVTIERTKWPKWDTNRWCRCLVPCPAAITTTLISTSTPSATTPWWWRTSTAGTCTWWNHEIKRLL